MPPRTAREFVKKALIRSHFLWSRLYPRGYRPYAYPGGQILLDIAESPYMLARALGLYEPAKTQAVLDLLQPGQCFADVGVNKGYYGLLSARLVGSRGRVLAFEPEPENLAWFRRSIELNGYDNIEIHEVALADVDGEAALHLSETSGFHSLVSDLPGRDRGSITVATRTLDHLFAEVAKIDMMKIDVEGAELSVLRGARATLIANRGLILLLDVHPQYGANPLETCAFLRELGFAFFEMRPPYDLPLELHPELQEILARRP